MKKKFLLVGLVAMCGFGAFVVSSCDDDDDTCTVCGYTPTAEDLKTMSCAEAKAKAQQVGCDKFFDNDDGDGSNTTTLSAPTGVSASQSGTSVNISWSSVSNATGYYVYRSSSSSGSYTQITSSVSTNAMDASPLSGYNYYKVKATNGSTTSDYSSSASVNYDNGGNTTNPSVPTGVTATAGNTSVSVAWNAVTGATSYKVYRGANGDANTLLTTVSTNSHTDATPLSGLNYYRVSAVNSAGESEKSSFAYCTYVDNTPLSAPTGVKVTQSSYFFTITWNAVSGATRYAVWYKYNRFLGSTPIPMEGFHWVEGGSTTSWTFNDGGVYVGETYSFWVVASNDNYVNSPKSSTVSVVAKSVNP